MQRVIAYIDGFNLYYGLKTKGWRRYYWLNLKLLVENLLGPNEQLIVTKYFTSRISARPGRSDSPKRQATYIEALETLPDFEIYYGHYLTHPITCRNCGNTWDIPDEKMTDVNIAVHLLSDAFAGRLDKALLISGDGDLAGVINKVQAMNPPKNITVAFPPGRFAAVLEQAADSCFTIGRGKIAKSQFPKNVVKSDGYVLSRPESWT